MTDMSHKLYLQQKISVQHIWSLPPSMCAWGRKRLVLCIGRFLYNCFAVSMSTTGVQYDWLRNVHFLQC